MAHSPHRNWRGCAMCKHWKIRGKNKEKAPWAVRRQLGQKRRFKEVTDA